MALLFTDAEMADIRIISEQWGVPPAATVYAIVADALADARALGDVQGARLTIGLQAALALVSRAGFTLTRRDDAP